MLERMLVNDRGKRHISFSVTGPGPDIILKGDDNEGYFGSLSAAQSSIVFSHNKHFYVMPTSHSSAWQLWRFYL